MLATLALRQTPEKESSTPDQPVFRDELAEQTHAALQRLPAKQRQAVELCFLDGLKHREAAKILNVPLSTLEWRVHAGLERLRKILVRRGVTLAATASVADLLAPSCEAAFPIQAKLMSQAALASKASATAITPFAAWCILPSWRWLLAGFVFLVAGGGSAAWWLSGPAAQMAELKAAVSTEIVQETLQEKNLRILDREVLPKVIEALKPLALGNGQVVLLSRAAYDHDVECLIEIRHFPDWKWLAITSKYKLRYDTLGEELFFEIDLLNNGQWRRIDPDRPIVLGRHPVTGKEIVVSFDATKLVAQIFHDIPGDPRAPDERSRIWEMQPKPADLGPYYPKTKIWTSNSKHLYIMTETKLIWSADTAVSPLRWRCIGRGCHPYVLSANENSLFSVVWNQATQTSQIVSRSADGLESPWQPVCEESFTVYGVLATKDYIFCQFRDSKIMGHLLHQADAPCIRLGSRPGYSFFSDGTRLYSCNFEGRLFARPANLGESPWTEIRFTTGNHVIMANSASRYWGFGDGGTLWSWPIDDTKDDGRFEGRPEEVMRKLPETAQQREVESGR